MHEEVQIEVSLGNYSKRTGMEGIYVITIHDMVQLHVHAYIRNVAWENTSDSNCISDECVLTGFLAVRYSLALVS